jgi:hypothetical protein
MLPDPELEDVHRCRHDDGLVFLAGGYAAFERGEIVVDGGERGGGERHALAARQTGRERKDLPADDVERRARENEEGQPHGEEGAVLEQLTRLAVGATATATATGRGRRRLLLRRVLEEALHVRPYGSSRCRSSGYVLLFGINTLIHLQHIQQRDLERESEKRGRDAPSAWR